MLLIFRFNKGIFPSPVLYVATRVEVSVLWNAEHHVVIAVEEVDAYFAKHPLKFLSTATTEMVATMPVIYLSELAKDKDAIGIFRLECVSYPLQELRPRIFKAF